MTDRTAEEIRAANPALTAWLGRMTRLRAAAMASGETTTVKVTDLLGLLDSQDDLNRKLHEWQAGTENTAERQRADALEVRVRDLEHENTSSMYEIREGRERAEAAEAVLATARVDALEAAAMEVDAITDADIYGQTGLSPLDLAAARIRALATSPSPTQPLTSGDDDAGVRVALNTPDAAGIRAQALEEAVGWRPIETAPKDGTELLLLDDTGVEEGVVVMRYVGLYSPILNTWADSLHHEPAFPTKWLPLPDWIDPPSSPDATGTDVA